MSVLPGDSLGGRRTLYGKVTNGRNGARLNNVTLCILTNTNYHLRTEVCGTETHQRLLEIRSANADEALQQVCHQANDDNLLLIISYHF